MRLSSLSSTSRTVLPLSFMQALGDCRAACKECAAQLGGWDAGTVDARDQGWPVPGWTTTMVYDGRRLRRWSVAPAARCGSQTSKILTKTQGAAAHALRPGNPTPP